MTKNEIQEQYNDYIKNKIKADDINNIWEKNSDRFRVFWKEKIKNNENESDISGSEIDEIVRILDVNAKDRKQNEPAVAITRIPQNGWRKMFKEIKKSKDIKDLLDDIFKTENGETVINLINDLYKERKIQYLQVKSAIALNCLLFAYNPEKYCSVVSLNHRQKITNFFQFEDAPNYETDTMGEKIYKSNLSILNGFRNLGINGSPRVISEFIYYIRNYWNSEDIEHVKQNLKRGDFSMSDSKNIILYGPPGTGKTYNAKNYAVALIEGVDFEKIEREARENHKGVQSRYNKYKTNGQIEFITFHQSYSYEEFVEGIKPITDEEQQISLKYVIQDGLFKKISFNALFETIEIEMVKGQAQFKEAIEKFKEDYPIGSELSTAIQDKPFTIIDYTLKSIRIQPKGGQHTYSLSYEPLEKMFLMDKERPFTKTREIFERVGSFEGLSSYYYTVVKKLTSYEVDDVLTVKKELTYDEKKTACLKWLEAPNHKHKPEDKTPKYVLIIDEINRGNVAKILGELITLIEKDKRIGEENEILAKLPYSNELFGVPPNLYIIGTMNTADRSVEALDTALRRRFTFKAFEPDPSLLEDITIDDVNLGELLKKINSRIEVLYDKDHLIGHSYFMGLKSSDNRESLVNVFKNSIIPLLQEYFYSDWGKIKLILGDSFIKSERADNVSFASNDDMDILQDYEDKYIFSLNPSDQWDFESI